MRGYREPPATPTGLWALKATVPPSLDWTPRLAVAIFFIS